MSFEIFRERTKTLEENYVIVRYELASTESLKKAAWDLAIGQSVGNPNVCNAWETDELFNNHSALILADERAFEGAKAGIVDIAFPIVNTDWNEDGIAQLLCQIIGGQADIDHIVKARAIDIEIPEEVRKHFYRPKFGLSGMRNFTGQHDKPLLGGIVKPKTGLTPDQLLDMTKQLVDGGVDFIKEDEILSNPAFCSLEERVPLISNYLTTSGRNVVYAFCINGDPHILQDRARFVSEEGGNGVHINIWSGLGAYNSIRKLDLPLYIHYQKSGDKVITHSGNAFGASWEVLCKLAALCGVDTIHTGMYGGYLNDDKETLTRIMGQLTSENVVPALSCGMNPLIVNGITEALGPDYLANVGGAIHGHPEGTKAGAMAMRQAIDLTFEHEYFVLKSKDIFVERLNLTGADENAEATNYNKIAEVYNAMINSDEGSTNFSKNNREMLLKYLQKNNPKVIVEIGVENNVDKELTSTDVILKYKPDDCYYFGIDLLDRKHLDNPDKRVYTIQSPSENIDFVMEQIRAQGVETIDFLFIDGWHSIAQCRTEFDGYTKYLADDGIVGFHDTSWHFGPAWLIQNINPELWDVVEYRGVEGVDFGIGFALRK